MRRPAWRATRARCRTAPRGPRGSRWPGPARVRRRSRARSRRPRAGPAAGAGPRPPGPATAGADGSPSPGQARLDGVEVAAVDLEQDLDEPRLLGLQVTRGASRAGSARCRGSRSARRSARACAPTPRPSRASPRRAAGACAAGSRARRARRRAAACPRRPPRRAGRLDASRSSARRRSASSVGNVARRRQPVLAHDAPPSRSAGTSSSSVSRARVRRDQVQHAWRGVGHAPFCPRPRARGRARSCGIVAAMALDPALQLLLKSHPWHGVAIGEDAPRRVTVFIEIVPTDTVKYELDKHTGILKSTGRSSTRTSARRSYGFIPQTLCAGQVAALCAERTGRRGHRGRRRSARHLRAHREGLHARRHPGAGDPDRRPAA